MYLMYFIQLPGGPGGVGPGPVVVHFIYINNDQQYIYFLNASVFNFCIFFFILVKAVSVNFEVRTDIHMHILVN